MEPIDRPDVSRAVEPSRVRASDDERHHVVELLGEHASVGRITLGELEERTGRALAATTRGELAEVTKDLPAATEQSRPPSRRTVTRWLVAILGGSSRRGRQRLSGRLNVVAVIGGDDIDLREAEIDGGELVINAFSLMGGPDIYLPDSVDVQVSGIAVFGGNDEHGGSGTLRPGAPVIRIRSFALFGGADIWRVPSEARALGLREARRAARSQEP